MTNISFQIFYNETTDLIVSFETKEKIKSCLISKERCPTVYNFLKNIIDKRANKFVFDKYSDTIRLMPANYCVCVRRSFAWCVDCDMAINKDVVAGIASAMHNFEAKWQYTGDQVADHLNKVIKV